MKRLMLPIAFILSLTGCSRLETAVKWADWVIVRETDSYFDLTDEQNKELKSDVQNDLQRVKKENFPEISAFFRKIAKDIASNQVDKTLIDSYHNEGMALFKKTIGQFGETATDFSFSATEAQIDRFIKKYKKKTDDLKDDLETEKDRYRMQKKRYERWIDTWIGDLNDEQEKALEEQIRANPFPWDLQIKSREYTLNKFLEARKNKQKLNSYFSDMMAEREPSFQEALKTYQTQLRVYVLELYKSLDQEQKDHLIKQLNEHSKALDTLANEKKN